MLRVEIPDSKQDIERQIKTLEYLLNIDTVEKDKRIHQQAMEDLKNALNIYFK